MTRDDVMSAIWDYAHDVGYLPRMDPAHQRKVERVRSWAETQLRDGRDPYDVLTAARRKLGDGG